MLAKFKIMKRKYSYTISTELIWTSFDYGTVDADNIEEARGLAIEELRYNFDKANDAFKHCDVTEHFRIQFNDKAVQVEELNWQHIDSGTQWKILEITHGTAYIECTKQSQTSLWKKGDKRFQHQYHMEQFYRPVN
jgi:hypothetical protein